MFSPILRTSFENLTLLYHNKNIITILQASGGGDGDKPLSYSFFSLQKCMQRCGRQVHPAMSTCGAEWRTCHLFLFIKFLRCHKGMKYGLNTQITQMVHSHTLIFKDKTWQTDFIPPVAGKKWDISSTHFLGLQKIVPQTSVAIITRLLYHICQYVASQMFFKDSFSCLKGR